MANKKLKIDYLKAYDYKASLATGVYGGITSTGLINANFYVDRTYIPESEEIEIDEKGKLIGVPRATKHADLVREVQYGVLMDLNSAKVIIGWLRTKVEELEKNIEKFKEDES